VEQGEGWKKADKFRNNNQFMAKLILKIMIDNKEWSCLGKVNIMAAISIKQSNWLETYEVFPF